MNAQTEMGGIPMETAIRAVEWQLQIRAEAENESLQSDLRLWLAEHPDHLRAWRRIEEVNARFDKLIACGTTPAMQAALNEPLSPARREAIKYLVAILGVGGSVWAIDKTVPWRSMVADYRTSVGEQRTVLLDDGTELILNTDSAVNIRFADHERRLQVLQGEVSISTGKDLTHSADGQLAVRPLVVVTAQGELHPLGTRFVVRSYKHKVRLDVFEGAVKIIPDAALISDSIVNAGQRAFFNSTDISKPQAINPNDSAWVDNLLVASGMRLSDFITEIGRYRPGYISCDTAIADLKVSGTYPLQDTGQILQAISKVLAIEVRYLSRYWVRVLPKTS